jgi:hypothetical protein
MRAGNRFGDPVARRSAAVGRVVAVTTFTRNQVVNQLVDVVGRRGV